MDCHMPLKNGYDQTRDIRELEKQNRQHTPIIAMTACLVVTRKKCLRYAWMNISASPSTVTN